MHLWHEFAEINRALAAVIIVPGPAMAINFALQPSFPQKHFYFIGAAPILLVLRVVHKQTIKQTVEIAKGIFKMDISVE